MTVAASTPADAAWLPAVTRWAGGPVRVTGRQVLTGGYVADAVTRVDLATVHGPRAVVLKRTKPAEVAAMRAVAVVPGLERPRLLVAGPDWLVTPHYSGPALPEGPDVPEQVWTAMARVHAHWLRRRPRGVPVADAQWWRALCRDRILPHVRAAHERSGDPRFATAADLLVSWADDPAMHAALSRLPRTLVHGDLHRGNVLLDPAGPVLIDWGNAKVAPPGLDLPVLRAQGAVDDTPYRRAFAELAGTPPADLAELETHCAELWAHVGYMGFAADHLGPARVAELAAAANAARAGLRGLGPG